MRIEFDASQSSQKRAVAAAFDLTGFSAFCSRHDANLILPRFLAEFFNELNKLFRGTIAEFLAPAKWEIATKVVEPNFMKFLGDGALMLWFVSEDPSERQRQSTIIVRVLRQFQQAYPTHVKRWQDEWGVRALPANLRVGVAAGHVFELREVSVTVLSGDVIDFAGYCINLAVRLQNHCREVPFLIHELVSPKLDGLVRLTARKMKGVLDEEIFAYRADLDVNEHVLKEKFKSMG